MNIILWSAQLLLAAIFLMAGYIKLQPLNVVAAKLPAMSGFPPVLLRFIGGSELLAAVGLIFPLLLGILPWLTPLAAAGVILVMVGAVLFHARRGEYGKVIMNIAFLLLACLVVSGRWALLPL